MKKRSLLAAASLAVISSQALAQDRTVLPVPTPPFDGQLAEHYQDARPGTARPIQAPQGAPNVFLMMSDDVGFAMSSAFGGPVPTPNFEKLAAQGQRYNRFHTTAICSPSSFESIASVVNSASRASIASLGTRSGRSC